MDKSKTVEQPFISSETNQH